MTIYKVWVDTRGQTIALHGLDPRTMPVVFSFTEEALAELRDRLATFRTLEEASREAEDHGERSEITHPGLLNADEGLIR